MNTSNELFRLVATMSKQEKRYFKLYTSFYSKEQGSSYMRLFDLIDKEKPASNDALLALVQDEPFATYLPWIKNQLTDLILSSLASYHTESKPDFELRKLLAHADILFDRGLYSHCRKMLARAEKKAEKMEQHLLLMEIFTRQRALLLLKNISESLEDDIDALHSKANRVLQDILSTNNYRSLMDSTQVLSTRYANLPNQNDMDKLQELIATPLLQDNTQATTFAAKIAFHNIRGIYALLINNDVEACSHYQKARDIWKGHPAMIEEHPGQYRRYCTNYLNCLVSGDDEKEFSAVVQEIKALPASESTTSSLKDVWNLELLFYMNRGSLERSATVISEIQKSLQTSTEGLQPHAFVTLCYNCGIFYFLEGKHRKTLEYLSMIVNESRIELKRDIQEFTRVFSLVAHYELQNVEILDNLIRSARRFVKHKGAVFTLEKSIFRSIRRLADCVDVSSTYPIFAALHAELCAILHHPDPRKPLGLLELLFWTESKLCKRPVRELFMEKMDGGNHGTFQEMFPVPG